MRASASGREQNKSMVSRLRAMVLKLQPKTQSLKNEEKEGGFKEICCLCDDVVAKILSLVPLKPRTRLKCVSRSWCSIINRLTDENVPSGLILRASGLSYTTLLCRDNKSVTQRRLGLPHDLSPQRSLLLDSRNGVFLFVKLDGDSLHVVCNLNLGMDRFVELPRINQHGLFVGGDRLFDCSRHGFKILCWTWGQTCSRQRSRRDIIRHYYIFSSDTWQWTRHEARFCEPSHIGTDSRKFYRLDDNAYVLICDLDKKLFSTIKLPENFTPKPYPWSYDRSHCVWESEGCLVYFKCVDAKSLMWTYEHHLNKWSKKKEICYNKIQGGESLKCSTASIQPLAFIEELQILNLRQHKTIFCYSFATQRLSTAWSDFSSSDVFSLEHPMPLYCLKFCILD